jgi:uncharacterized membrane protein
MTAPTSGDATTRGALARIAQVHRSPAYRWATWLLRRSGFAVALVLALLVGVLAVAQYARYDPAQDTRTTVNFAAHPVAIVLHAVGASCAPLLGLLQWSTHIRRRWPVVHRWLGRVYLVSGVAIGGTSALWLSFFAYGGPVVGVGMSLVAVCWLVFSTLAYSAIRAGDVAAHRRWMMRSVALALGGVTLRVYLPLLAASGVPFLTAYRLAAWGSWVPNLLVAELVLAAERRRARNALAGPRVAG